MYVACNVCNIFSIDETEIETTVIFTYELVKCSKATSISDKIIITKAKLQAISDAIIMCSKKALKNSEI